MRQTATALSIPAFRRVWAGATVSAAGDAASWVALVALALETAHASLPLLAVLYTAPVAVGGLVAGWALDRFDRRRLMIGDCVLRGAVFASIPVAAVFAQPGAGQLYAVAGVYGLLKMVSLAGFPSLIPALVPESRLDQANALEEVTYGLASLAGAGLGGLAIATAGPVGVVAFDAASYLVMALTLWSVRGLSKPSGRSGRRRGPGARGAPRGAGFRLVVRLAATNAVLRDTTIMFALANVGWGALLVFLPHRALQLGLGTGGYGYLVAAGTAGELLAALLLTRLTWRAPLTVSIVAVQIAAALVVVPLVVPSAAVTVAALVALGMCEAPMTAWAQSLRMRLVPAAAHGRLFALLRTVMQGTLPAGAALAALVIGRGAVVAVAAIAATIGVPALVLARDLLRAPGADREPAPAEPVNSSAPAGTTAAGLASHHLRGGTMTGPQGQSQGQDGSNSDGDTHPV
jgi:MFS family permease